MATDGDNQLRQQLDILRVSHFEELVDQRALALVQQEVQEQDAASTERAIIDSSKILRERIISVQAKHLRIQQATRLGRWLMTRRSIPEIRFGFEEDDGLAWGDSDMTVATAPLMATTEETVDGSVNYGWVFQLKSPTPEAMVWSGKEPPIHAWGRYGRSSIDIYRVAEDEATGLQSKEKWFTINPQTANISCWKLAEQRRQVYGDVITEPIPEDEQCFYPKFDEETGKLVGFGYRELSREAEQRERQRMHRYSDRVNERYAPDQETGLHLLGLIRGSIQELG